MNRNGIKAVKLEQDTRRGIVLAELIEIYGNPLLPDWSLNANNGLQPVPIYGFVILDRRGGVSLSHGCFTYVYIMILCSGYKMGNGKWIRYIGNGTR